ncbi:MAG TPA: NAD(P)-dependent oxidoreductase [Gemmatimonadales bacterium]|nr:NAD(P)-dependent oxidoreductase [Gemmatimonadales bacterium]
MKVAFIGLGHMGVPMAENVRAAGHELLLYNRTRGAADRVAAAGGTVAESPAAAARAADAVITMLADDGAVRAVTFGPEGILEGLPAGGIHVGCSTIGVALADELTAAHAGAGQHYLSAPVFGRPDAAAARTLRVVAAGAPEAIARVQPVLDAVGHETFVVGASASLANVVKLAGNFMIAAMLETLGEAFALTGKAGIPPARFLDVLNGTFFALPIFANYAKAVVEERYEPAGFKLALGLKDVRLALEAAGAVAVPMPLASLVRDHFLSGVARGYAERDWTALARVVADDAGL